MVRSTFRSVSLRIFFAQKSDFQKDIDTVFNYLSKKLTLLIAGLILFGCTASNDDSYPTVSYIAETEPVVTDDDAADDPAIWINLDNTANSLIFGTDKKSGIYVYDLKVLQAFH